MKEIRLLEVGSDFKPVVHYVEKNKQTGITVIRLRELIIRPENITINIQTLKRKIRELTKQYPDKGYYCERVRLGDLIYWRFGRRDPKAKAKQRDPPLYFQSTLKRLYVPSSYALKKKKLTSKVVCYRLTTLGIPYSLRDIKRIVRRG